ncbi:hypothetical protein [Paenibacillus sp. 1A_MP2]|uniref:hypothetical protein n=1 Tax=Paenibacillus sp. 1A_MP2 TaxID=3457495 RepID=UPI003FCEC4B4
MIQQDDGSRLTRLKCSTRWSVHRSPGAAAGIRKNEGSRLTRLKRSARRRRPGASAGVQEQLQESGRTKAAGWPG